MNARNRGQTSTRQAPRSAAAQGVERSDGTWRKFAEPRGWALKWDGSALAEIGKHQNVRMPFPTRSAQRTPATMPQLLAM